MLISKSSDLAHGPLSSHDLSLDDINPQRSTA